MEGHTLEAVLIVKRRLKMPRENIIIWASREDDQAGRGGPLSKDSNIARHDKDEALRVPL